MSYICGRALQGLASLQMGNSSLSAAPVWQEGELPAALAVHGPLRLSQHAKRCLMGLCIQRLGCHCPFLDCVNWLCSAYGLHSVLQQ